MHLYINGHLSCFHILAIINNVSKNTVLPFFFFFLISSFGFFRQVPRHAIAKLCGSSIFKFLRNHHTVPLCNSPYIIFTLPPSSGGCPLSSVLPARGNECLLSQACQVYVTVSSCSNTQAPDFFKTLEIITGNT